VRREFIPFDEETILGELRTLTVGDRAKLQSLIEHYEMVGFGNPSPAQVDDYGDGLFRLRHIKPAYQGRLIYFAIDRTKGFERLVILTVYKKQSQKTPSNVIETAMRRKKQWEERKGKR
jgi:phage-related protein